MPNLEDMYRGDTRHLSLIFETREKEPVDLTGAVLFFTAKKHLTDTDADAVMSKRVDVHTSPLEGRSTIVLTPEDTEVPAGKYYYDVQIVSPVGEVTTLLMGSFRVLQDVTRRVE